MMQEFVQGSEFRGSGFAKILYLKPLNQRVTAIKPNFMELNLVE